MRSKKKYNLILKSVTITDPIMGWFGIMKHTVNKDMVIVNLAETVRLESYT